MEIESNEKPIGNVNPIRNMDMNSINYKKSKTEDEDKTIEESPNDDDDCSYITEYMETYSTEEQNMELGNESNADFIDDITSVKSPSAISVDSAKGSSILNDGSWMAILTGDLFWGQIFRYCYWPCLVCPDPDGKTITTNNSDDNNVWVHVRFFADKGRRNWIKFQNLIQYSGIESYKVLVEEARGIYGEKNAKFKLYVPTKAKEKVWLEAVNEADTVSEVSYADRVEKYEELLLKSKAFKSKRQRKFKNSQEIVQKKRRKLSETNSSPTTSSLISQKAQTPPQHSATPTAKPLKEKPLLNRPILEVIDNIFKLDNKYLFKGMNRDPVCKYCFKTGENLRKCAKNCSSYLHSECLHLNFTVNGEVIKRANKRINSIKSNTDTANGSGPQEQITENNNCVPYVTGDSEVEVVCKECTKNEPTKCLICKCTESTNVDDILMKCTTSQCDRTLHPACCKYWPQSKITISKNHTQLFRCPSHVCHTCVSDDPKGKFQHITNSKLTKCLKCPATFHTDSTCIPAGSQILSAANIICPRHTIIQQDMKVNVNWCFICVGGGELICCETCPMAAHTNCLKLPIATNEDYICTECESGRMPLYGEIVWAKFRNFRWWPAIILPPTEIPTNIAEKAHNSSDFVVRFFGSHDHGWISRRRVYLYLEGDSAETTKSKSNLDLYYTKGVEEAKDVFEILKDKKLKQRHSNESKEKLLPQPYIQIKANRSVPPVKLHIDIDNVSKCECNRNDGNPCGPYASCLNRALYHECHPKFCPAGQRCQNQMFESRISPLLDVVYMKERGFGLVSREPIKAGSFVIEYVGEIINQNEFQARMKQKSLDRDENFYFLSVEKDYIIDAGPKGNLARFMNHSCEPNCETQKWLVNSLNRIGLFAIKDIPENTELTFNYHWDNLFGNEKKTCYCGSEKCAGQIGAKL